MLKGSFSTFVRTAVTGLFLLGAISAGIAQEWELVWSDEFDYRGLPDPLKWDYEEGFVRNEEAQYYTRDRLENARVEDGMLVIEAHKESFTGKDGKAAGYTSASLMTKGKAQWTYGRIEARAKFPRGKGAWPAIWTLGGNIAEVKWPACGEIDIMEFWGKKPEAIYGTLHYSVDGKKKMNGGSAKMEDAYGDFHVYAIEWFPDRIDFFCDDKKYYSMPLQKAGEGEGNPYRKPHYLLVNYALGGKAGGPIEDAALPQKYLIDYVRVYKSKPLPGRQPSSGGEN